MNVTLYNTINTEIIDTFGNVDSDNIFILKHGYTQSEKETLLKLISAVKLSLENAKVIVLNGTPFEVIGKAKNVVIFGFNAEELSANIHLPEFKLIPLEAYKLIIANSISELNTNKDKKIKLWTELQKMYNLV